MLSEPLFLSCLTSIKASFSGSLTFQCAKLASKTHSGLSGSRIQLRGEAVFTQSCGRCVESTECMDSFSVVLRSAEAPEVYKNGAPKAPLGISWFIRVSVIALTRALQLCDFAWLPSFPQFSNKAKQMCFVLFFF